MRDTTFITKDTKLFVSLAEWPGNTGTQWFNQMFTQYEIDAVYKAFRVERGQFQKAFEGVRALGVAGGAVSMPFKREAAGLVDDLDQTALEIGAINTFIRGNNSKLKGFNTDYLAALKAIPSQNKSIYLLGSGGVAAAVAWAVQYKKAGPLTVISRSPQRNFIPAAVSFEWCSWSEMSVLPPPHTLINCTSLGMNPTAELEIPVHWWSEIKTAIDLTYRPEGNLFSQSVRSRAIDFVDGKLFSRWQALAQLKLYTGIEIENPLDVFTEPRPT